LIMSVRHFINLDQYTSAEVNELLRSALEMKAQVKAGIAHRHLEGKNIGMLFDKSSLRTRVSFEVGINQLGASAIVFGDSAGRLGEREPIADFGRVISRYVDAVVVRTFEEERLLQLAKYASVPVINALTDESHPCQSMADMLTLKEHWGSFTGKTLVYVGDSNNVARSLMRVSEKLELKMRIVSPVGYEFSKAEKAWGMERGFEFFTDPQKGVLGADALYTDVWTSMGQEKEKQIRLKAFQGFCLNKELLSLAAPGVKILHCLPAHRGEEISDEVIESQASVVFDQAENRLHAQKAIMLYLLKLA
jgi:ornithine carbamoyltransferase